MRVVFDTNIYISAFVIPGGNAEEAYLHAVRGRFELFTSIAILTETANTLSNKFAWSQGKIEDLLTNVGQSAVVVKTQPHIHILRDEPDNRILECATWARAQGIGFCSENIESARTWIWTPRRAARASSWMISRVVLQSAKMNVWMQIDCCAARIRSRR